MATQQLGNPKAAFQTVTSFVTGRTADGEPLAYGSHEVELRADATITRGAVLMFVAPTATVPLSVTPMTVAAADNLFAGIAYEAGVAGDIIRVVTYGHAIVDVAAETAAFGSLLTAPATTTGKAEIGATEDATLVVSSVIGIALGIKDSGNLAAAWINHR